MLSPPETSPEYIQGVLGELALSLPYERASCKVCQTFRQTNSEAEDRDGSGQTARLSCVGPLAYCQRPAPDGSTREKKDVCLCFNTEVFFRRALRSPTRTLCRWSMSCHSILTWG